MKTCIARLKSVSPYSQSKSYSRFVPKLDKEGADDYENRTWREKTHVDENGEIVIPGMAFKMALDDAAKRYSQVIPGKGKATYTKHFVAGILVLDNVPTGVKKDEVEGEWIFVNADGVRGSGKRVWRCFPVIRDWEVDVTFYVGDDTVTKEIFEHYLAETGKFVGIGRFAPRRGGFYGRFSVVSTKWS
jgi:hypothetical protein